MEVNDSNEDDKDEDVQLTDRERYEPRETCIDRIGSQSLNPSTDTHYIDTNDDSSVEDQPEGEIYSDEYGGARQRQNKQLCVVRTS